MTKIISMSLNEDMLRGMDALQKERGFSGRSEVIRAGIRLLLANEREKSRLKGIITAVLVIIYEEPYSPEVSKIRHSYPGKITTQIHNHIEEHRCLETFILSGEAKDIKRLYEQFETSKKVDFCKLMIP